MKCTQINLSANLRYEIKKKNLSQNQLSKEIGIRGTTLHGYLYGVIPNGLANVIKLAKTFDLTLDQLVLGKSYD